MSRPNLFTPELWMDKMGDWIVPEPNTGCWLWTRKLNEDGYGANINWLHRRRKPHQIAFELMRGPVPERARD